MKCINSIKIIEAVKKIPAIWDKNDKMYLCHKKPKVKLWIEVCRDIYNNWDELSQHEKHEIRFRTFKRWQSLRTSFVKELVLRKKEKRENKIKKETNEFENYRTKYQHFNRMIFLLKPEDLEEIDTTPDTDDEYEDPPVENMKVEYDDVDSTVEFLDESILEYDEQLSRLDVNDKPPKEYNSNESNVKILDILKKMKTDKYDDDRQFILSLIPNLKRLNERQKLEARIGIMKVLQEIRFQTQDNEELSD